MYFIRTVPRSAVVWFVQDELPLQYVQAVNWVSVSDLFCSVALLFLFRVVHVFCFFFPSCVFFRCPSVFWAVFIFTLTGSHS